MEKIVHRQSDRNEERLQANRQELVERIAQIVRKDGEVVPFKGLHLFRVSKARNPVHSVSDPSFCVIAQGSKEILLSSSRYLYDPAHYLITTVDLPRTSQILEASPDQPYLSLRLELDPALIGSLMIESGRASSTHDVDVRAIDVNPLDVDLLDAVVRLVRLVDCPTEAQVLQPLITREILYRLLVSEQGNRLRHLAILGGYTPHIPRAIEWLRRDFDQPLRIENLARDLGMSVSGFHHHFKAVTALSPLQYQKQIRLQEARRLMLGEELDAASAAFRVGYHDASHFSREYKSLFGAPPMRDVQRLREAVTDAITP